MMKKVLSILISICMLLSTITCINFTVFAEVSAGLVLTDTWQEYNTVSLNQFTNYNGKGNCTWYVDNRWNQINPNYTLSFNVSSGRSAGNWYNAIDKSRFDVFSTNDTERIISNSIGVKVGTSSYPNGHVVYIELVKDGNVYFTEDGETTRKSSWKKDNYGNWIGPIVQSKSINDFKRNYQYIITSIDTQAPSISNITTSSVTSKGYTISCTATDNIGVALVTFDTYKGDKLISSGNGKKNGNTWSYKFDKATVSGSYYTKITARDSVGNVVSKNTKTVSVKCKVASPKITSSNTTGGKNVSISCSTSGSTIYYKLDNGSYKKYTGAFKLSSTKTVYSYATKSNYSNSSTTSQKVSVGKVATPTISSKNYIGGKTISISTSTSGATIYYKTSSKADYKKYTGSFKITDTKTIYAYANKSGSKNSSTAQKKISISTTAKPTGVKATASSSSAIKVSWKQVSGASGYYIYQATSKNGTYKKVATVTKGSTLSKSVGSLSASKTYYFKVKAYTSGKKTSAYSSVVSAKTKNKVYNEGDIITVTGTLNRSCFDYKGYKGYVYYLVLSSPINANLYVYPKECDLIRYKVYSVKIDVYEFDTPQDKYEKYLGEKVKIKGTLNGLNKGQMVGWQMNKPDNDDRLLPPACISSPELV